MVGIIRQEQLFRRSSLVSPPGDDDRSARSTRQMVLAGAVLGLAALTRSSVVYFVFPGAALYLWIAPNRPTAWRRCAWWVGTFLLVVTPYTALVSAHSGRFLLIEDIGYFNLKRGVGESGARPLVSYMDDQSRAPTAVDARVIL
jgi:hypothetical protein